MLPSVKSDRYVLRKNLVFGFRRIGILPVDPFRHAPFGRTVLLASPVIAFRREIDSEDHCIAEKQRENTVERKIVYSREEEAYAAENRKLKEKMDRLTMLNALLNMDEKGGSEMMMEDTLENNMQEMSKKEKVAEITVYPSYAPSVSSPKSERISEKSGKEVYGTVSNGRISIKEKLAQMKEKVSVSKTPKPKDVKRTKNRDCL